MNRKSLLLMTTIGVIAAVFGFAAVSATTIPKIPAMNFRLPLPVLRMPASITIPSPSYLLSTATKTMPVAPPMKGGDVKIGDGDIVGKKLYIYKCKICDMPRMFKMKYGSFVF